MKTRMVITGVGRLLSECEWALRIKTFVIHLRGLLFFLFSKISNNQFINMSILTFKILVKSKSNFILPFITFHQ